MAMKSLMNGLLAVVLLALTAWATDAHAQWQIGGVLDINRASASVEPELGNRTYHGRTAFGIGAVVDYPLAPQIDVHGQIMLLGKGQTMKDPDFTAGDVDWKTRYVEIPLLVRYTLRTEASAHPYVAAGPSFGILRSAKFSDREITEDDEDAKSFDMSIVLGAGVSLPRGTSTFFGEVRYAYGLVNVVDESGIDDASVKHRGLQLLGGITFPVGKK